MKEKYLLAIQREMFWHFSSSEIRDTIKEINMYFESALQDGESEKEVIEKYGQPKMFVSEMRTQSDSLERKRKQSLFLKFALLVIAVVGMVISVVTYPSMVIAECSFVIFSSLIVWHLAGSGCIITMAEKKKKIFWVSQIIIAIFFLFLQSCAIGVVPYVARNHVVPLASLGFYLKIMVYSSLILLGITAVIFIKQILYGNVYMFFCAVQNISLIYGVILYYDYLKHIEDVNEMGFLFIPFLICIPVLFVYWAFFRKYKKDGGDDSYGCTN